MNVVCCTCLVGGGKDAARVGTGEVLDAVHLAVVPPVRLVELDAAPVALAEVRPAVVPQHAALDARNLDEICCVSNTSNTSKISRVETWFMKPGASNIQDPIL